MTVEVLKKEFCVCRLKSPGNVSIKEFTFLSVTDEEISLVCTEENVPNDTETVEKGWRGFRIKGVLDFSLIGILSKISAILAKGGIGIFAVSTYNTDYIFVKKENFDKALQLLKANDYTVI